MLTILAIAALTAPPLELHAHPGREGRYLRACFTTDYYVVCERTAAIRHYQDEIRRLISCQDSLDNFLVVGRTRTKFPPMAMDSQGMVILFVKREIDTHNRIGRLYKQTTDDHENAKHAGMITLGSVGRRRNPLPLPWKYHRLTAFQPPQIQE